MASGPRIARPNQPHKARGEEESPLAENVLYAAGDRARQAALELVPDADDQEVASDIALLCDLLSREHPSPFHQADDTAVKLLLRARLISLLRTECVRTWTDAPPAHPTQMLRVLQGLERIQGEIDALPVYDDARQRLQDNRGLELVVELAHDLRSPLTSILFLSETLLRGGSGGVNEIQHRQLGIIYSAALGLIGTASDVIELARGGEHLEISEAAPFSLLEILQGVCDMVMPIAEEKSLQLHIASIEPDRRFGHPVPLSRVLLNLTTNALKFTDSGKVELTIEQLPRNRVELSVKDTGRGIEDAALATLFQPIRRRSGGRRGYQIAGTGLGLSICRKLVSAMGGELQLETSRQTGTRFFFQLDLPAI
jgi:signal transduction histidine kinase